jgi:hypothetical protein
MTVLRAGAQNKNGGLAIISIIYDRESTIMPYIEKTGFWLDSGVNHRHKYSSGPNLKSSKILIILKTFRCPIRITGILVICEKKTYFFVRWSWSRSYISILKTRIPNPVRTIDVITTTKINSKSQLSRCYIGQEISDIWAYRRAGIRRATQRKNLNFKHSGD